MLTMPSALKLPGSRRRLKDLSVDEGPPLTTTELAQLTGMSPTFIRGEIRSGHLRAVRIGRGQTTVFRILVPDARNYAQQLGLL